MNKKIETATLQDKLKLEEKIKNILDSAGSTQEGNAHTVKTIKLDKLKLDKVHSRNFSTNLNTNLNNINSQSHLKSYFNSNSTQHKRNKSQASDVKSISTKINKTQMQSEIRENLLAKKEEFKCEEGCRNLHILVKYETVIKELMYENEKLKKINQFFMISMGRKDDYLLTLLKENTNLSTELNKLAKRGEFEYFRGNQYKSQNSNGNNSQNINASSLNLQKSNNNTISVNESVKSPSNVNIPQVVVINQNQNQNNVKSNFNSPGDLLVRRKSSFIQKLTMSKLANKNTKVETNLIMDEEPEHSEKEQIPLSKLLTGIVEKTLHKTSQSERSGYSDLINNLSKVNANSNFTLPKRKSKATTSHYEEIIDMFNKKARKGSFRDTKSSFLTASNDVLSKIIAQDIIKEILKLTNNDEDFLQAMRTFPDDKLIVFSDSIATLIKDYDYSIKLIKRIKSFLQVSIRVVNTMILEDAITMIIKNSCEILDCDRTSIYVHDKLTNMLVIHAGDGLKKGEWKIPPDKGIVGYVFTRGERQKIDDAYLDARFNIEVDKKTGYKTKSMLCVPLKDEDGKSFGVIQALNKKGGALFSADDEELIDVFANQASSILKNSMRFDENLSYISRLKMLLNYTIEINSCTDLSEFTYMSENLLAAFWSTNVSQILIFPKETHTILKSNICQHYRENGIEEKPNNIGLVGRVKLKKELIAINSGYDNPYFNNIVDLESGFSLLTFPIFEEKNENKIIAIGQVGYPFKIHNTTNRPKEIDADVINYFANIASCWLTSFLKTENQNNDTNNNNFI